MRIIVIGATGTIGKEIVAALEGRHEIVRVGQHSGEHQVDIASRESTERLFQAVGSFDALVPAAGQTRFNPLEKLSEAMGSARNVPGGGLPARDVARAYVESVEGNRNGEVLDARDFAVSAV